QRREEQAIDDAENRRVGADPQREREHRDRGEDRCLPPLPPRESYVLPPCAEPREHARATRAPFPHLRAIRPQLPRVPEPPPRLGLRLGLRAPERPQLRDP